MLIPLWRQASYLGRRGRLRSIAAKISDSAAATAGCFGVALGSAAVSAASPLQAIDDSFTCPITGESLPERACTKSSLKLHDACVF